MTKTRSPRRQVEMAGAHRESPFLYKLPLVLTPQPEGGYTVTCPLLPELVTDGDTMEAALDHVPDALAATLEIYEDLRRPVPSSLLQTTQNVPVWFEALVPVS